MILLSLLIIPLVVAILSFIILKGIDWKEFLIHLAVSLLISSASIGIIYSSSTSFTEIINSYVINKHRDVVHCRHSYDCNCYTTCSGSGENRSCTEHCSTCYDHSFDVDWVIETHIGRSYDINTEDRQGLLMPEFWSMAKFGDPISFRHTYTNYIKASSGSLFKNEIKLDSKYMKYLPEYPNDIHNYYNLNRLLNLTNIKIPREQYDRLSYINGQFGETKQSNIILLIVPKVDRSYLYALDSYWSGANKNDIVIIISTDGNEIFWSDSFYLGTSSLLKISLRNSISELEKFDMDTILDIVEKEVTENYIRKSMKNYEYLKYSITPTKTQFIVALILNLICSFGLAWFFHENEF